MKQLKLIIALLFCFSLTVSAQKWKLTRWEAIAGIGTVNYFGDIGGAATPDNWLGIKDFEITNTRASLCGAIRYKIQSNMAIKANFIYGFVQGNDKASTNDYRNYSFSSHLIEPSVQFEYSIFQEERRSHSFALFNRRGMLNNYSKTALYVFAGVGGLYYYPTFTNGRNRFFKTESVNTTDHFTYVIPVGIGLKYVLNSKWMLGFEFTGRYTGTDNFDGLNSVKGFSEFNDIYYFGTFQLIYRLRTARSGWPVIKKRRF